MNGWTDKVYEQAARAAGFIVADSGTQFIRESNVNLQNGQCEGSHADPREERAWEKLCTEKGIVV